MFGENKPYIYFKISTFYILSTRTNNLRRSFITLKLTVKNDVAENIRSLFYESSNVGSFINNI